MKELSASDLTKEALIKLRARGNKVWRQQNISYGNRKNIATPGIPDIIGWDCEGRFLAAEVKTKGDRFSQAQQDFLNELKKKGGIALVVTQDGNRAAIKEYDPDKLDKKVRV